MSPSRSSFISGTIFGIILGVLVGHFGIWNGVRNHSSSIVESFPVKEASLPGMSFDLGKKSENLPYFPEEALQPVDDYPEPKYLQPPEKHSPLANAIAMETVEVKTVQATSQPAVVEIATPAEEPQPLDIDDAAPIEAHKSKNDVALKKVIEEELNHIPAGQREVWFESLKDMHVDDAQGVIRMWKLIGGPIPGLGDDSLLQPPVIMKPPKANSPKIEDSQSEDVTKAAIKTAVEIVRRNLMMESTLGYVRVVPRFHEKISDGNPVIAGIVEEFDFTQGEASLTTRVLDLMIQGPGFFEVKSPDGNLYVTRRGRFSLNEDRQIAIIDPDAEYILQPPITIPKEAKRIQVAMDGKVSFKDDLNQLIGEETQIQTVQILSSAKLAYYQNGLLEYVGDRLMSNELLIEHRAEILQGFLETSNVDESIEKQHLQRFQELLRE
ncbi:MAG: hypothetical protein HON04_06500 [Planctomicrobium sp.]|jgi:flagellar basal body rod protein FlgF|nr:hypothetical protein [Planctomicrobium sp.]